MAELLFQVNRIESSLTDRCIYIKFSKDVDPDTITSNSISVLNKYSNVIETTVFDVSNDLVTVKFLNAIIPNAEYVVYVHPVIKSLIESLNLSTAANVTIIFESEVTSHVAIISPVNYQKFDGTDLKFSWQEFGTSLENIYRIQIASENAFNNIVWDEVVRQNSVTCSVNIDEGQYYVRVRAEKPNASSFSDRGVWSGVVTFLTAKYENESDSDTSLTEDNADWSTTDNDIVIEDRISPTKNEVTVNYEEVYEIMPDSLDILFSEEINTESAIITIHRRDV